MKEKKQMYYYVGKRLDFKKKIYYSYLQAPDMKEELGFSKNRHFRVGEIVEVTQTSEKQYKLEGTDELIDNIQLRTEWLLEETTAERKRAHVIAKQKAIKEDKHLSNMTVKELLEFADKSMNNSILVRSWINSKTVGFKSGWKL